MSPRATRGRTHSRRRPTTDVAGDDHPNVAIHPPILALVAIGTAALLDRIVPVEVPAADLSARLMVAGVLLLPAALLGAWAILRFLGAGTNVLPHQPSLALVVAGPYRWTRNPMYLGLLLGLAGLSIASASAWLMVLTLPTFLILDRGVVAREERYLLRKFGPPYHDYMNRVRRWL